MLANFATEVIRFVKVMPTDYKRVLEAMAKAAADGADENEAVMAASRT